MLLHQSSNGEIQDANTSLKVHVIGNIHTHTLERSRQPRSKIMLRPGHKSETAKLHFKQCEKPQQASYSRSAHPASVRRNLFEAQIQALCNKHTMAAKRHTRFNCAFWPSGRAVHGTADDEVAVDESPTHQHKDVRRCSRTKELHCPRPGQSHRESFQSKVTDCARARMHS